MSIALLITSISIFIVVYKANQLKNRVEDKVLDGVKEGTKDLISKHIPNIISKIKKN